MISINGVEYLKTIAELQADQIPGGVLYTISDENNVITWKKASEVFDLDVFQVGYQLGETSVAGIALKECKDNIANVLRVHYGIRLKTISQVLVDDEGKTVGVFSTLYPMLHPIAKAFPDFAPILANMFTGTVTRYYSVYGRNRYTSGIGTCIYQKCSQHLLWVFSAAGFFIYSWGCLHPPKLD